ncbi:glycosyltransferase family 4 protein [Porticoccus sp. GXU_MW_L64]
MDINRKKILWLSHFIPYPPKGGSLLRSYNLINQVAKYHDVYLLSFVQSELLKTMFENESIGKKEAFEKLGEICDFVKFIDIPCEKTAFSKYALAFLSLFSKKPYSVLWLKSKAMDAAVLNILKSVKFDVIHFDTISLVPYSELFPPVSAVLNHHNIESHMMLRRAEREKNILKKYYYYIEGIKLEKYEKNNCSIFNKNLTCSELDTSRLKKLDSRLDVDEVCNGVDVDYFTPDRVNVTDKSILFVGGMNWYPNKSAVLFFINKVWPLLVEECPDVTAHFVGQSPPEQLLKLAELDPRIFVHGFVDDVRPYMNSASVYACPINDGGGTKLKILDALAMSLPIVANPIACEGISVINNESVFYAETEQEYIDTILMLFSDKTKCVKAGEEGRKLIMDKYTYKKIGKKLTNLYQSL